MPERYKVSVVPNSQAAQVGIRVGDRVVLDVRIVLRRAAGYATLTTVVLAQAMRAELAKFKAAATTV